MTSALLRVVFQFNPSREPKSTLARRGEYCIAYLYIRTVITTEYPWQLTTCSKGRTSTKYYKLFVICARFENTIIIIVNRECGFIMKQSWITKCVMHDARRTLSTVVSFRLGRFIRSSRSYNLRFLGSRLTTLTSVTL